MEEPLRTPWTLSLEMSASHVYAFVFKRDRPASETMAQIKRQGRAERFAASGEVLHLVGVSFSTTLRTIDEWMEERQGE